MLTFEPDDTVAHRLDPRSKFAFQVGFAIAALANPSVPALALLTGVALVTLRVARAPLLRTLYDYRLLLAFLVVGPPIAAAALGPPWIDVEAGRAAARASYRVLLILLVSAAYVRSTPIRHSRAAIQRTIPGKPGQFLGIGVGLVFRFLPVMQADLRTIRDATDARLGHERSIVDRASRIGVLGLDRAFDRADRLSLALQARCFSWNPTLPPLSFSRADAPVLALGIALAASAVL